eukprot:s1235_g9.t1
MAQLLLVLLARSTAELGPGALLRAAVDEASLEAAELAPAADARPSGPSVTPPPLPPLPAPATSTSAIAAAKAIASAAAEAAEGASAALEDASPPHSAAASPGLSEEVAALVKAAKAKEWRPEAPKAEVLVQPGDQSAFLRREAHRRWQVYFKMAASRLEAPQTGDAVEEYHLLYEVINQIIAGLQFAAEASQGRGSELSRGFAHVSQLLRVLERRSRGTAFENEDFLHQAHAAASLGCGNRPFEDRFCDRAQLQRWLGRANHTQSFDGAEQVTFENSWLKYLDLGFAKGIWRKLSDHQSQTFNPSEVEEKRSMWQLFPTYIMAKDLRQMFSSAAEPAVCRACRHLTAIVLEKYHQFRDAGFADPSRPDEVNNAFFTWQLTHHAEQSAEEGQALWPELYGDATFRQLKSFVKTSGVEYLQEIYSSTLSSSDFEDLELSIWASVTSPLLAGESMGLAFHDHPLSLLSGVFYADAGGASLRDRTPTVFADPRGTKAFRYATGGRLEPMAPFHRLAYSHAKTGMSLVFPSWLVHGVAPHHGPRERVVFAYNLHTSPGSTLASDTVLAPAAKEYRWTPVGFQDSYEKIKLLGEGAFGAAYLVRPKDLEGWEVEDERHLFQVAKEIRISHLTDKQREGAIVESEVLRMLKHPNIIAYINSFLEGQRMYIIMEYANGGDLGIKIKERKDTNTHFEEWEIMRIFVQLVLALTHIHARKVLHRDLKPLNVFLTLQAEFLRRLRWSKSVVNQENSG